VQANHLETTDPEALYLNYRSFAHEPNGATPSAIAGLAEAYSDLPQNEELAMSYAGELLRAGDSTHAVDMLRRIAYQPHGGEAAKWAQSRLKSIESAETVESPATAPR
jgi:thioredoxin-like negative regulator of GroEL